MLYYKTKQLQCDSAHMVLPHIDEYDEECNNVPELPNN